MTMKITSHTVGSWFPTGFYGHHRMRNRVDFINEYRHLAKPQPPDVFLQRSSGYGKKKHPQRSEGCQIGMVGSANVPHSNSGRPLMSSYKRDFKAEEPNIQMLVRRPMSTFDSPCATTVYRTVHGTDSPNHHLINAMSNESLMLSLHSRQHHAVLHRRQPRETVAACMSWYKPVVPSISRNQEFNHIYMKPAAESGNSCPPASETSVQLEGSAVQPVECSTMQIAPEC